MKKNLFYFLSVLLLTISFSSCNKEENLNGKKVELSTISFEFGFPKGDPVTYAIHDSHEYGFKSLFMYEFDEAGRLLKAPVDLKSQLTGEGPEYSYKHEVPSDNTGIRQFIFVANEAVPSGFTVGSTIATLQAASLSKTQAANASSQRITDYTSATNYNISMTGVAKSGNSNLIAVTGNSVVSVEMVRTVARIDVENNTPNLIITELTLNNVPTSSLLFESPNGPSSTFGVNGISTFATLPSPSFDYAKKLAKAFYLYEGRQESTEAPSITVNVKGTLSGLPVEYNIPFGSIDVRRNYIYRISLGDGTPTTPNTLLELTTITTANWSTITLNDRFSAISAAYNSGAAAGFAYANSVLTTNNTAQANILFDLSTNFTGHTAYTVSVTDTPSWIAASIENNNQLKLDIQANNDTLAEDREAVIEVKSTTATANTYVYKLVVKQSK